MEVYLWMLNTEMMSKKAWFYVLFFTGLSIAFYVVLTQIIPGYGEVRLPVLNYVKPFSFINQDGKTMTERDTEGKVYVAEYFFTTCQGICPNLNRNLKTVFDKYRAEPAFAILSHTSDPVNDDAERLRKYADSLHVNHANWWFLTGEKDNLYNAARVSYLLDDPKNNLTNIEEQFLHTQYFALVDKSGRVRKIYDGLKKDEIAELSKDIETLLRELPNHKRFVNNVFSN
ncbi:MAG TPA: SCO family protein [Flavitalea sp.]|nr:SCO family protein [Flavitalea sp.]